MQLKYTKTRKTSSAKQLSIIALPKAKNQ